MEFEEFDMNRSFQKLLQLFAGVALLSMASLSMAATYDLILMLTKMSVVASH